MEKSLIYSPWASSRNPPPPLGRATPSPEPSGLGLAAPVCLCRWLVRSTSACGGSHLVAQPVSGGLHSFLGAGAQRGANAALAGTGHGFSEMHALSIFGVKVWAMNIEKKIRRETLQDLARQSRAPRDEGGNCRCRPFGFLILSEKKKKQ